MVDPPTVPAGGELLPEEQAAGVLLCRATPRWEPGTAAALEGLVRCAALNGTVVVVCTPVDACGRLWVQPAAQPVGPRWRVDQDCLSLVPSDGGVHFSTTWRDARRWAGEVRWLPPQAFGIANARAAADLLHEMAREVFPGDEHTRGVAVDAALYPRVRPRGNLADTARGNNWVPETTAVLRTTPVPQQCQPVATEVVQQLPRKSWPAGKAYPFPQEISRGRRGDEQLTPFEQVVEWCDAYDHEWRLFLRGQQKGKRRHRFDYTKLPGGRRGLLIEDYCTPECAGIQWDHRPYWESGGELPCVPFEDEHPQLHTDWDLEQIARDGTTMGVDGDQVHADKNLLYELTKIGFRSFSEAVDDNCVMLFPNRVGLFKDKAALDFVRDKSEEERRGFAIPMLYGSSKYPQLLCCRLHPRNVCTQRLPADVLNDDGTSSPVFKRRQTVDCGVAVEPTGDVRRRRAGASTAAHRGKAASTHEEIGVDDRMAFNDAIPTDGSLHPPLRYSNIRTFAEGLAVLKSSGIKVGAFCKDARAYYRFLVTCSREIHCGLQWVDNEAQCEMDSNLQFGMKSNCSASTRTSVFLLSRIRDELRREQQRWRDDGRLDNLDPADRAKLESWEAERREAVLSELRECERGWRQAGAVCVEAGPAPLCGLYEPAFDAETPTFSCEATGASLTWCEERHTWRCVSGDSRTAAEGPRQARSSPPWDEDGAVAFAGWTVRSLFGTACGLQGDTAGLRGARVAVSETRLAQQREKWCAEVEQSVTPWWCDGCFIDDFFGGAFHFFLPAMIRVFDEVFDRYNITMADGRIDPMTDLPSKDKFEQSFDALTVLGIEIEMASVHGHLQLAAPRAEMYARAAEAMVGERFVPRAEFESLFGRITFAAQALPKLRGLAAGLLGVQHQGWSTRDYVALGAASWGLLASAAVFLRENEGCVLYAMRQPPGAADRPLTWVFTDAARDPDAPRDKYVGFGVWIWPEGADTVFASNGRWADCEQELDITSLELFTANLGLELAQWVQVSLAGPGAAAQAAAATADLDVVLVSDNLGATQVSQSVRATSPSLRALLAQRAERMGSRPRQRCFAQHCFREQGEEADDLSKDELDGLAAKLELRFGRPMRVVMLPPPPSAWRSLGPARLAMAEFAKGAAGQRHNPPRAVRAA